MKTIDGSFGEGGGQVLRTSLTLAAILGIHVRIENIRSGRKNPGLQPQHLTAARAVAKITNGRLAGDEVGSQALELHPRHTQAGDYVFDVSEIKSSAGSVHLILQTILLPLALSGKSSRVTLKGGTHVPWSPTANYVEDVYLPMLSRMGVLTFYKLIRAGYYPIGGGEVHIEIRPTDKLSPIKLMNRGQGHVVCTSAVSNLPMSIAERQLGEAMRGFDEIGVTAGESLEEYESLGKGTVVFIGYNDHDSKAGFTSLGERGKPAEKVAREAFLEFAKWWKSETAVDKHLADQLIVPMALAKGESEFTTSEITQHLMTNVHTIQQFIDRSIEVTGSEGRPGHVRVI